MTELPSPEDDVPERPNVLILRSYARDKVAIANGMMKQDAAFGVTTRMLGLIGLILRSLFRPISFMNFLALHIEEWVGPVRSRELEQTSVAEAEDAWKQHVSTLVSQSQMVLILPGTTPGLAWELAYLRSNFSPEHIFLLNEPSGVERIPWSEIVWRFEAQGWLLPSRDPGPGTVLSLDGDWRASVFARDCRTSSDYAMAVCAAWNEQMSRDVEEGPRQFIEVAQFMDRDEQAREDWESHALGALHGRGGALLVFVAAVISIGIVLDGGPGLKADARGAAGLLFGVLVGVYGAARAFIFFLGLGLSTRK